MKGGYPLICGEARHPRPVREKDAAIITLLNPVVVRGHKICVELDGGSCNHGDGSR